MVYFLYDYIVVDNLKKISCLSLKEKNGKIIDSKLIQETIELNEDISIKWPWSKLNRENHILIKKDIVPDMLIPYVSILKESLDHKTLNHEKNIDKEDYPDYKKELKAAIVMFNKFIEFNNNPEKVFEFQEFNDFKTKYLLNDYEIEDWLIDMEDLFREINGV